MKKLGLLVSIFISVISFGQNYSQIDPRLLANKEVGSKAAEYFSTDPAEYNFLLFELENAYFIRSMAEVTENQKGQLLSIVDVQTVDGVKFDPSVLADPATFNFHLYNFQRSQTKTVGYDLGNGNVLVFYSIEKLRLMYSQKSSN
jgi:Zn-dependent M32 family carboxypeptidase